MSAKARQPHESPQMALPFDAPRSFRAAVLAVINDASDWLTAREIAARAQLTYAQTVFALYALHNNAKIARTGRKFTARWGKLALQEQPNHNFQLLESLFHAIAKPR